MTVSARRAVLLSATACALCGCAWMHQRQIYQVVNEYCQAEQSGDIPAKVAHLTPESMIVIGSGSAGGPVAGIVTNPLGEWRLASYEFKPDRITIRGDRAYAAVTGKFVGPRNQQKSLTFTVHLQRYREPGREGKEETVWRINEIQTKYELTEAVVGKGYGDLWMRQIETQRAWERAAAPRSRLPAPDDR